MISKFYILLMFGYFIMFTIKILCYLIIRVVHSQNTLRLFSAFNSLTWFGSASEDESQVKCWD